MGLTAAMLKDNKVEEAVGQAVALAKYPNMSVKMSASPGISREPYPFRDVAGHLTLAGPAGRLVRLEVAVRLESLRLRVPLARRGVPVHAAVVGHAAEVVRPGAVAAHQDEDHEGEGAEAHA
jgi:hypothetical protein